MSFMDLNSFSLSRENGTGVTSDLCSWRLFDSSLTKMVKEEIKKGNDPRVTVYVSYETYGNDPENFSGSFGEYLDDLEYSSVEEYLESE